MDTVGCTINVGGGPGGSAARTDAMIEWAKHVVENRRPAIVFAQETTAPWLQVWDEAGYEVCCERDSRWRIRSALITSSQLTVTDVPDGWWSNTSYHGSYLAAGLWTDAPGGPLILASVHASPNPADLLTYPWVGDVPIARHGGGDPRWSPHTLWDSDLVAASLVELAGRAPILAGGDFNESRLDDGVGDWGSSYFKGLEDQGMHDISAIDGVETFPTRNGLQLDHVLASTDARERLAVHGFELDPAWTGPGAPSLSDHTALWFSLDLA